MYKLPEHNTLNTMVLSYFRVVAILEGISYLLLVAFGMPLKYWAGIREPNLYIGYIHGFLFIAYTLLAVVFWSNQKWGIKELAILILASLLPFGTFYLDAHWLKPREEAIDR